MARLGVRRPLIEPAAVIEPPGFPPAGRATIPPAVGALTAPVAEWAAAVFAAGLGYHAGVLQTSADGPTSVQ